MRKITLWVIAALLCAPAAFADTPAEPSAPFPLSPSMDGIEIASYAQFLEDKEGALTIDDVAAEPHASQFAPIDVDSLNKGISSSAFWIRIRVANKTDEPITWFTGSREGFLDQFSLYVLHQDGGTTERIGDEWAAEPQPRPAHRIFLFRATTAPGAIDTVYVRKRNVYQGPMSLDTPIWSESDFEWFKTVDNTLLGVFYGGLAVMFFYNLFLYLSVRDRVYLYYVSYVFFSFFAYASVNGIGKQWIWYGYPVFVSYVPFFAIPLSMASIGMFTRYFLNTPTLAPRYDKLILGVVGLNLLIFAISATNFTLSQITGERQELQTHMTYPIYLSLMIATVVFPAAGVYLWTQGVRLARLYVVGWSVYLVGVFLRVSADIGLLYKSEPIDWAPQVGSWLEIIILSIALGDRINLINREKKEVEKRYTEALKTSKEELEVRVTERTAALASAKDRAEKATTLKDKFVSLVSHDLRSPLGSVRMLADTYRKQKNADADALIKGYDRVASVTDGLIGLIDKLLDVSRLQTGAIELRKRLVSIHGIGAERIEALQEVADSKGITIVNDLPESFRLFVDPPLYGEALANLLGNAVKFCRAGDTITLYSPEGRLSVVAVKDSGPGVDETLLPDLFKSEVKTTLPGSADEKGTGLGLPYCREIMVAHGGDLTVESTPGVGATFYLTIPETGAIILLVDDQKAQREMMKETLGVIGGVDFVEAEDGKEALRLMKETPPHLVISDISMPIMNGYDLIGAMRSDPALADIPIIVATSSDTSSDGAVINVRNRVFSLGADDFVTKPVSPGEFIPRVRRFVT